jgi:hypothetical protein
MMLRFSTPSPVPGLHLVSRSYLPEVGSKAREAFWQWQSAHKRRPLFLQISHAADGSAAIIVHHRRVNYARAAELLIRDQPAPDFSGLRAKDSPAPAAAARAQTAPTAATQGRGRTGSER